MLRTFWGWEVQTQKIAITNNFMLTYKRMATHIHTTSVILQTPKGTSNMQRITQLLHGM